MRRLTRIMRELGVMAGLDAKADALGIPAGTLKRAKERLREPGRHPRLHAKQIRDGKHIGGWQVSLEP